MKNDQKNPIYPYALVSCMLEHINLSIQVKQVNALLRPLKMGLHLNIWFKWTHLNLFQLALAKTHSYCHIIACIILCIALIVFLLCLSVLFPLGRCCTDAVIVDTDEDPMISSEVPGKQNPLVHSNTIPLSRSCSILLHQDNNDTTVTCCGS